MAEIKDNFSLAIAEIDDLNNRIERMEKQLKKERILEIKLDYKRKIKALRAEIPNIAKQRGLIE